MVQGFFFVYGGEMANVIDAQKAFSNLLDIEYEFVLGRKSKSVALKIVMIPYSNTILLYNLFLLLKLIFF